LPYISPLLANYEHETSLIFGPYVLARDLLPFKQMDAASIDWLCWQLADSAFPSGGFAHSSGLEAGVAMQQIHEGNDLCEIIQNIVKQQAISLLPLFCSAYNHPAQFLDWDQLADATLTQHVAHRASRAQGRAMLRAVSQAFPSPELESLDQMLRTGQTPGHLAPVFGLLAVQLSLPLERAAQLFVFQALRSVMSAAVRLGVVGPIQAQRITHQLTPQAQADCKLGLDTPLEQAADTAPMLTLMQANQDRLYSRLFQS